MKVKRVSVRGRQREKEGERERKRGREKERGRESWYLKSRHDTISDGHQITNRIHSIEKRFLVFLLYGMTGLNVTEWEKSNQQWLTWRSLLKELGNPFKTVRNPVDWQSEKCESEWVKKERKKKGRRRKKEKKKERFSYFNGVSSLRDSHVQSNDPSFLESVPGCPHSSFEASNCFQCYVRGEFNPTFRRRKKGKIQLKLNSLDWKKGIKWEGEEEPREELVENSERNSRIEVERKGWKDEMYLKASEMETKENSWELYRMRSSARRDKWIAVRDDQKRNSATKSRSETAWIELLDTDSNFKEAANSLRSMENGFPAMAPLPRGQTLTLVRREINRSESWFSIQA